MTLQSLTVSDDVALGRTATSPAEIPVLGWRDIGWRLLKAVSEDRILLTAAGVTFYFLLGLVPGLTAFVALYGLFLDRATALDHVVLLAGIVPPGGLELIAEQLGRLTSESSEALGVTLLISLCIAFWSSSAGVRALFEAMNVAYQEREKRSFFLISAMAIGFTLCGAIGALMVIGIVVVMPVLLSTFTGGPVLEWVVRIAAYLVMLILLAMAIAALYRWGPSRREARWRWITPGAIVAVVVFGLTSIVFSWYVSNYTDYGASYGSLGALIGLLTWIWISVTVVIAGAELNSEIEHQTAYDSTTGLEKPMGTRGAYVADSVGDSLLKMPPPRDGDLSLSGALLVVPAVLVVGALLHRIRR
jgi:membrane protein